MVRDYSDKNLRGEDFKEQNLKGIKFINSDIRGVDFTNAKLENADFQGAKAGLQPYWKIFLLIVSFTFAALLVIILEFIGQRSGDRIIYLYKPNPGIYPNEVLQNIWIAAIIILMLIVFIFTVRQGLESILKMTAGVGLVAVILNLLHALIQAGIRSASRGKIEFIAGDAIRSLTGTATGSITGIGIGVIAVAVAVPIAVAQIVGGDKARYGLTFAAFFIVIPVAIIMQIAGTANTLISIAVTLVVTVSGIFMGGYIASQALKGNEGYSIVFKVAVVLASIGGTSFRGADITNANFSNTTLKNTDFRQATVTRTCWFNSTQTNLARWGSTILIEPDVRNLLVGHKGGNGNYIGRNLKGANLAEVDLSGADLTEADISGATLEGANLEGANLTKTQALGANFSQTTLTGACLEAWNTDSSTQLQEAICGYVFLLSNQRERRPSSGNFAPGEFGKLYQEFLDTVVLIFRNGVDWKAFVTAFKNVQVENEGTLLTIQSIENKGDDVVLVRVNVPPDADKAKIHSEFNQHYEDAIKCLEDEYKAKLQVKDSEIIHYREQNANMWLTIHLLAARPMRSVENIMGDKLVNDQSRNINVSGDFNVSESVFNIGEISGKVTNAINQLPDDTSKSEQPGIKELLIQLKEKIEAESQLPEKNKTKALKQVEVLAQAWQNPDKEAKRNLADDAITMLRGSITVLPKLLEACSHLFPLIEKLFSLSL
ncbi:pentapeptide repeat-containing protein [Allocoleopsis sp.]|uniref:pentapeptide repeat-containing protein n=1 Tax=Allocoleopsis sp. TaxID=3088169 RepID=UPI002FD0B608